MYLSTCYRMKGGVDVNFDFNQCCGRSRQPVYVKVIDNVLPWLTRHVASHNPTPVTIQSTFYNLQSIIPCGRLIQPTDIDNMIPPCRQPPNLIKISCSQLRKQRLIL